MSSTQVMKRGVSMIGGDCDKLEYSTGGVVCDDVGVEVVSLQ